MTPPSPPADQSPLVSAAELADQLGRPGLVVLDVTVELPAPRFDGDYRAVSGAAGWERAHLPGSRHVDLLHHLCDPAGLRHHTRPAAAQLAADLAELGIDPDATLVLYDRGATTWAARAWWVLRNAGISARVLDGGLTAWTAQGLPVEHGATTTAAQPVPGHPAQLTDLGLWADRDDVQALAEGRTPGSLVCALSAEHFAATIPTRYARRGHIPRSVNLSARTVLDAEGRLLAAPQLRTLAETAPAAAGATALTGAEPVVVYCGGGVSACLTALALTVAGISSVRVYDGSLDEWSADPSLPLETDPPV
ncbi:rhodanese-like domain-containing protein [Rhodococcus sp. X156]|uniref:sulfurtransferase n=1 Tax=Rhodococcus sp. X156 TaxID=2499145 RepID=UPI000FDC4240|nr:rhodanese-like domain-containing protein [Rhodococcus sp. X156]